MAISSSSSDCNGNKSDCCATVVLNVYDLTPLNNYTHWIGFGIFHSGIEDDLSRRLTGKRIPGWVNRLANLGALCSCLLPESLQVSNVKQQMPEWHVNMDDSDQETDDDQEINGNEEEKHLLSQLPGYEDVSYVKEVQAK
ncbi:hypothetical protein QN277_006961 [Acacia crassicarpa]|uniref:PPPDE domain-containing protein n=1 Tax=Acacia crassicarpa TaxID=499986 RepID=A0AAE1M9Y5_9FABA|nr:hypothetical protein QN277_006961 [Acacia crassicarpa]